MAIVETFNEVIEIHGFFRDLVTSSSLFCSAVYGEVKIQGNGSFKNEKKCMELNWNRLFAANPSCDFLFIKLSCSP